MYFTPGGGEGGRVALYDGDKIASLAALLIKDLIAALPPNGTEARVGGLMCGPRGLAVACVLLWGQERVYGQVEAAGQCAGSAGLRQQLRAFRAAPPAPCACSAHPHASLPARGLLLLPPAARWALSRLRTPTAAPASTFARSWAARWRSRPRVRCAAHAGAGPAAGGSARSEQTPGLGQHLAAAGHAAAACGRGETAAA